MRVVKTRFIPPGRSGWTFRSTVFIKPGLSPERERRLLLHESVHVEQFARHGTIGFLVQYMREYLVNMIRLRSHKAAYHAISFEVEARFRASQD